MKKASVPLRAARPTTHRAANAIGKNGSSRILFLEAVQAAIIVTDNEGRITYWNPFSEKLYGWSSEEVINRNIMEIAVSTETEQAAENHMAELRAGIAWSGEFEVRGKNGGFLTALMTLSPLVDQSGSTIGIIGVSQDLSRRKQTEEELRNARVEMEKRVQERTAELNKANESLRDLSTLLMELRDQEARRLARELHDSVGQLLAAMSMNISAVKSQIHKLDEVGAKAVEENTLLVEQISTEIRTISHLLHPPLLDELGLGSALQWYVEGFSERSKIKTELEVPSDLGRLPTVVETAIFRIVQECLTNIHRHSGSKTASVRIIQEDYHILVVAQDSGRGIPPEKLCVSSGGRSGVGFRGMTERIRHLGGNLNIHSDSTGTVVTARLPLEDSSHAAGSE